MPPLFTYRWTALLALCLLVGAAVSVWLGQDANWDLRNYHIANVHGVVSGRLDTDLLPAGLQSYFNPTLDFPYVLLAMGPLSGHPRLLAALMGLPYGGLIFLALRLATALLPALPQPDRALLVLLAAVTAVTGAATLPQVGTTFNDMQPALLVLSGLLLALAPVRAGHAAGWAGPLPWGRMAGIGLLFGLAAGVKLTALIFAPAFCLALLPVTRPRVWVGLCLCFTLGWLLGFLPVAGWWGWMVWERFGSPTFPLFNALFRSPWYPPENFFDTRFLPRTALQWIAYPFWWVTARQPAAPAELVFRDPRLALAWLAVLGLALAGVARGVRRLAGGAVRGAGLRPEQVLVLGFLVMAYGLWLSGSAILRYAIVLEVAGTLMVVLAVIAACRALPAAAERPGRLALVTLLCLGTMLWTRPMDWGRVRYGKTVFEVDMAWTPPDTLLVAITGPTAYLGAFVPPEARARMLGFSFTTLAARGWKLAAESERRVRAHAGPIFVLIPEGEDATLAHLPAIGLSPEMGLCRRIASNLDNGTTRACEARRLP